MKKVPVKNAIVFGIIAIIAAVLLWCTSLIGPKEYYPLENDTKLQILVLGDSNMADFGEETIPQMLAEQLPATVYNYGIGGIAAAKVNVQNYFDNSFDLLCLYNITKIMQTKDSQVLYDFYKNEKKERRKLT